MSLSHLFPPTVPTVIPPLSGVECRYIALPHEQATVCFAQTLAPFLQEGQQLWLRGELGAGKTYLARALLRALGHQGTVPSPSYPLALSYSTANGLLVHHIDCYRLQGVTDWCGSGLEEYLDTKALCIIEWPERVSAVLPPPAWECFLVRPIISSSLLQTHSSEHSHLDSQLRYLRLCGPSLGQMLIPQYQKQCPEAMVYPLMNSNIGEGTPSEDKAVLSRRRIFSMLISTGLGLVGLESSVSNATPYSVPKSSLISVRVWPARDYTRVVLELKNALRFNFQILKNPERLVLDLEGIQDTATLRSLTASVIPSDPYIAQVRASQYQTQVMRLVFDMKQEVVPEIFELKPIAGYQHRLVIDLYPPTPPDPILSFLAQQDLPADLRPLTNTLPEGGVPSNKPALPIPDSKPDSTPRSSGDKRPTTGILSPVSPPSLPKAIPSLPKFPSDSSNPVLPDKSTEFAKIPEAIPKRASSSHSPNTPIIPRLVTIAIDAGHGGEDPGAVGKRGTYEKNITLAIARRLAGYLLQEPNIRPILIRNADYFLPLNQRVQKAQRARADLMVSIHADAFRYPTARGSSVFCLSVGGASSSMARWMAERENHADSIGGVRWEGKEGEVLQHLLDLSTTAQIRDSLKLGSLVLSELGNINHLHKNKVEQASFAVLKSPDIPSILVETAFISNPEEEARLNDPQYQDKTAMAIFRGIRGYFSRNPPLLPRPPVNNSENG